MKKLGLFLSLLVCSTLIAGCNKQENFSQVNSKEYVATLLADDGNLIFPTPFNNKTQTSENILSVLSKDQIDIALQIMSENLAKMENENERPDWTYQDYYDLALTQYRSIRNVSLELYKKDLNELSVDEYLDILDNHLSELYENAVSIAPSEKIKNAVWGGDEEQEPEISKIETLKQSFTGTIIDGTNLGTVEITQDDTLYFNDKFGFAVILGKEWNGGKIEAKTHNEQFGENAISRTIQFYQKGFDYESYKLSIDKNDRYDSMKKHDEFWTEEDFEKSTKGRNNKYYFLGGIGGFISPSMDTSEKLDPNLFPDGFIFYDVE